MPDQNFSQNLNFNYQPHPVGASNPANNITGDVAETYNAVYKPVPPPKPLSSLPTYRMPPPPTGAGLYNEPPIPGAACSNYEMQSQNLRTHSSKFPVSDSGVGEAGKQPTFHASLCIPTHCRISS